MGKGQATLRRIINEREPRLSLRTPYDGYVEVEICGIQFLEIEYTKRSHLEALRKYYNLPEEHSHLNEIEKQFALIEEVEQLSDKGLAKDRAAILVEIFEKNLDQIVIGIIWLAHKLGDLSIYQDAPNDAPANLRLVRVKSSEIEKIFDEFMSAVKDQMGAISGRPPNIQLPNIVTKSIGKERQSKLLQAMHALLKENPDDELKIVSIAKQMKESRSTIYRWIDESDIELEDLRIKAQKLSRKT